MIENVGFVIHAGEITTPEAVESFRGVTRLGVLGNNNLNIERRADAFEDIGSQNRKIGNTLVINPGTTNGWFFGYNATVSIFDTKTRLAEIINL
jgi:predicted phosphodiesterase